MARLHHVFLLATAMTATLMASAALAQQVRPPANNCQEPTADGLSHMTRTASMLLERQSKIRRVTGDANRRARQAATPKLASSEYDEATGTVHWPIVFEECDIFLHDRSLIDSVFSARADGDIHPRQAIDVRQVAERMRKGLIALYRSRELDCQGYINARTFLDRVCRQASFPTTALTVVVADR